MSYYLSLQFSAIRKTVLRHDRLWSIAGIGNILARLNEIDLPAIAKEHDGEAIVAGGGKFTARFADEGKAEAARSACVMLISTTLPMLEFQVSERILSGDSFNALAKNGISSNPAIRELSDRKRAFRGYAVSFNPHLKVCEECGEYPAQRDIERPGKSNERKIVHVCRICHAADTESRKLSRKSSPEPRMTTLQKVYRKYLDHPEINAAESIEPAADFNDLFRNSRDERKRMAVWFSDLNNMSDRVPVWLKQDKEDNVRTTFDQFSSTVVEFVVSALVKTFGKPGSEFLPFRLVAAGGDDLCLVMAEKHILDFTRNISAALNEAMARLKVNNPSHPLTESGLRELSKDEAYAPKPFGFGAGFVVTSVHTPFSLIHQVGEELMSTAKKATARRGNSVNWRIMAEETAETDKLLTLERPLFIEKTDRGKNDLGSLSFNDYLELRDTYIGKFKEGKKISGSHLKQIVAIMRQVKNPYELDRRLKLLDATEADKSFSPLLRDGKFRDADGRLMPERIATLFELLAVAGGAA